MARVLIPLADGFEDIEAVSIIDVLRRGEVEVVTAAVDAALEVSSAHGILMKADTLLSKVDSDSYDAIILPGGGTGTKNLMQSETLTEMLKRHRADGKLICAICAAPTILIKNGIIDKAVQMTCYPTCADGVEGIWINAPVIEDGLVITGQAPGSALLFSLVVLKTLMGPHVAEQVAGEMITDVFQ